MPLEIDDPGYPMDVAVSDNGVMMVTFQYVDGSKTTSYVAFYNYGDVGPVSYTHLGSYLWSYNKPVSDRQRRKRLQRGDQRDHNDR